MVILPINVSTLSKIMLIAGLSVVLMTVPQLRAMEVHMKTILCYGDSLLWGFIPGSYNSTTLLAQRLPRNKRCAGVLQNLLGEGYEVIEDTINGRTTSRDEITPGRLYRNGLTSLPSSLEAHYPIDFVIFLLGTNDMKIQYNCSVSQIAEGARKLIKCVKSSHHKNREGSTPKILLISPPFLIKGEQKWQDQYDESSSEKSKKLAREYQQIAQQEECLFLDASGHVTASKVDGVHLDESQCNILAHAIANTLLVPTVTPPDGTVTVNL